MGQRGGTLKKVTFYIILHCRFAFRPSFVSTSLTNEELGGSALFRAYYDDNRIIINNPTPTHFNFKMDNNCMHDSIFRGRVSKALWKVHLMLVSIKKIKKYYYNTFLGMFFFFSNFQLSQVLE